MNVQIVTSFDPNDKVGSQGAGTQQYISGATPLRYAIFFENVATATAPAQEVVITDQLDVIRMDLSTFSLGLITFGDTLVTPPPGLSQYTTDVDLRPADNLIVRINAGLDMATGLVTWRFVSLDPATKLPTEDPLAGFLPPNQTPPEGQGSVLFTVKPKQGLPTGTEIRNQATIVFDVNVPINTPEWFNTLDNTKPSSQILSLPPTQASTDFAVQWSGTDVGSGIKDYTIFVSENGGPYTVWLSNTPDTAGNFAGENGKTYAFYSVARDQTNNVEDAPLHADATTTVQGNLSPVAQCQDVVVPTSPGVCTASASVDHGSFDPDGDPITLSLAPAGPYSLGATPVKLTVTDNKGASNACTATVTAVDAEPPLLTCPAPQVVECTGQRGATAAFSPTTSDNCPGTLTTQCTPSSGALFPIGSTPIACSATDASGNSSTCRTAVTVQDTTAPVISSVSANPSTLWPPNHTMVPVTVSVAASDTCDATPTCKIVSVSSNEPVDGLGDGDTAPDWAITGNLTVNLRAERSGTGSGRVYTNTVQCTDASGHSSTKAVAVTVPHDQGKK